ncbi:MAG TPA: archaetidylserine decarboxylase [Sphingomonas sp.]|jgi:phosphatidylserine decarboxylase|nr:archaetidylserine decarboxylase [Sphingomonas sp.]
MTAPRQSLGEALNFIVTNRLPRRLATRIVGRVSKSHAWPVAPVALALWKAFCDVDLRDAERTDFASLHDGFTRALRPGARPFDPDPAVLCAPCDAIVGAYGLIEGDELLQVKGMPYSLTELAGADAVAAMQGGSYVTMRLTAGMYHRFHAPADLTVERVEHRPGDRWNVNPPALARVSSLYCRNERAIISTRLADGRLLVMIPVAAILVAGIVLHPFGLVRGGIMRTGLTNHTKRGAEMGWFEHGSTIVMLAPSGFDLAAGVATGETIRAGRPLLRRKVG